MLRFHFIYGSCLQQRWFVETMCVWLLQVHVNVCIKEHYMFYIDHFELALRSQFFRRADVHQHHQWWTKRQKGRKNTQFKQPEYYDEREKTHLIINRSDWDCLHSSSSSDAQMKKKIFMNKLCYILSEIAVVITVHRAHVSICFRRSFMHCFGPFRSGITHILTLK